MGVSSSGSRRRRRRGRTNHATEKVERKEVPGGTLKDARIWKPLGPRSGAELAVDRPVPMLLASLGCGDF
jgi:hypothetical protein